MLLYSTKGINYEYDDTVWWHWMMILDDYIIWWYWISVLYSMMLLDASSRSATTAKMQGQTEYQIVVSWYSNGCDSVTLHILTSRHFSMKSAPESGDLSRESGECNKHHEWINTHYMHRNCCLKKKKLQVHMHPGSDPAHTLYTALASCVYDDAWHCCEVHLDLKFLLKFFSEPSPSISHCFLSSSQLFWQPNNCVVSRGRVSPCSTLGYISTTEEVLPHNLPGSWAANMSLQLFELRFRPRNTDVGSELGDAYWGAHGGEWWSGKDDVMHLAPP